MGTVIPTAELLRTTPGGLNRRLEACQDEATLAHYSDDSAYEAVELRPYRRGWGLLVRGSTGQEFLVVDHDPGRAAPEWEARAWATTLATKARRCLSAIRGRSRRIEGLGPIVGMLAGGQRPGASTRIILPGLHPGREYFFRIAGPRSRHPGSVSVTDGGRYPDNRYYGRIEGDTFIPGRDFDDQAGADLSELAESPIEVLALKGRLSGRCCFCGRELTTSESTEAGYGPVCADRFGLPWGRPAPSNVSVSHEPRDDDPDRPGLRA